MKILLSAYACAPGKGSEQGVGWNWAVELKKINYDVYVLTRSNNAASISAEKEALGIHFIYYDLPLFFVKIKKYIGIHLYYILWQYFSYRILKKKYKKNNFDIVHHITFVSFRFPTFLYKLGGKFILGPIGGGEQSTMTLIKSLPIKNQCIEFFRIFINKLNKYNFFINKAYKAAAEIHVTTLATFNKIPLKFQYKTFINSAIGINNFSAVSSIKKKKEFVILFAGNLLHWKGIHLAILAFSSIRDKNQNIIFKIVGSGNFRKYLVSLVNKLKLSSRIIFIPFVTQKELFKMYSNSDIFIFPSFHDSGGFVVLEAMSFGLTVICLGQGGPADILGKNSENVVDVNGISNKKVVQLLASRLNYYIDNPEKLIAERTNIQSKILKYNWQNIIGNIYNANTK